MLLACDHHLKDAAAGAALALGVLDVSVQLLQQVERLRRLVEEAHLVEVGVKLPD